MVNLPKELLSNILVRLPIKSVSRFRCVDKAWCRLLKCPNFLKMHHKHALEMNVKFGLMLRNDSDIYTLSYDSSLCTRQRSRHVKHQGKFYQDEIEFFGCCNGLVLLRHVDKYNSHIITIWNPATDESRNLPYPAYEFDNQIEYIEYGIGYHYQIEDYKVVSIAALEDSHCEVQVYTLKKNSWRWVQNLYCVDDLTHRGTPDMSRLPVDGAIYWIADIESRTLPSEDCEVIIYFDIERENFDEMQLPRLFNKSYDTNLCVFGGSLCLLGFDTDVGAAVVWEWKLNGVKKSWTKLFTIDLRKHFGGLLIDLMPLLSLKNGEILLGLHMETGFQTVLYDPKHGTTRMLIVHEDLKDCCALHASVYVESKVSLGTGTYLEDVMIKDLDEECDDGNDSENEDAEETSDREVEDIENAKKKSKKM
ncbi:hypothetical protein MKX01_035441 [Papaver californicum]|nr:hypothetical protein MKX01_035441 [Papaver californicum]